MKNFVLKTDFQAIATEADIAVLTDSNDLVLSQCNKIAIDEASGYLNTKYDLEKLFADPILYIDTDSYLTGTRLYTIIDTLDEDDVVISSETKFYSCIKDAIAGTELTDTEFFTEEDTRDSKLLEVIMSISLFYVHKRLSPNNIPTFRVLAYDGNGDEKIMSAIKWLNLIQKGTLNPYNWPLATIDINNPDEDIDGDPLFDYEGTDPGLGIMWGNDMGAEYFWYNNQYDKNKKSITI